MGLIKEIQFSPFLILYYLLTLIGHIFKGGIHIADFEILGIKDALALKVQVHALFSSKTLLYLQVAVVHFDVLEHRNPSDEPC